MEGGGVKAWLLGKNNFFETSIRKAQEKKILLEKVHVVQIVPFNHEFGYKYCKYVYLWMIDLVRIEKDSTNYPGVYIAFPKMFSPSIRYIWYHIEG